MFRMPKDTKQPPAQRAQAAKINKAEMTRRDLLRSGAAVATATLAPGVTLMAFGGSPAEAAAADAGKRWGLLIDVSKCKDGCTDCVTACSTENGWSDTGHPETGDVPNRRLCRAGSAQADPRALVVLGR